MRESAHIYAVDSPQTALLLPGPCQHAHTPPPLGPVYTGLPLECRLRALVWSGVQAERHAAELQACLQQQQGEGERQQGLLRAEAQRLQVRGGWGWG